MPRTQRFLYIGLCPCLLALLAQGAVIAPAHHATVTISGTVIGPEGPVTNVSVNVNGQFATTNASGLYSVTVQPGGRLNWSVRPPISTRLAQVNLWLDGITANYTQNFTVAKGYLLSLRFTGKDGSTVSSDLWVDPKPLRVRLPDNQQYSLDWDPSAGRGQAVLPPDVYYLTATHLPVGYYDTSRNFDLRTADQNADVPLNTIFVPPFPYDPPIAAKISIGPPDDLGEATVTGAPGAALPLAHVLLVNLNSANQGHATSETDGSFAARVFAPPGSAIMIKHGFADRFRWKALDTGISDSVTPYPGTIIHVPHTITGSGNNLPFAATGAISYFADDSADTRNYVGAAWAIEGTFGSTTQSGMPHHHHQGHGHSFELTLAPHEDFEITGKLRIYSPAITATTDPGKITVKLYMQMTMLFNAAGHPLAEANYMVSSLLTPSGFPILGGGRPALWVDNADLRITGLKHAGTHTLEGDLSVTGRTPDLPPGIYRPRLDLTFSGVPTDTTWIAANVTGFTYGNNEAILSPFAVGTVLQPHLIWRILMDDMVQGNRGAGALEDQGIFGQSSQIVTQGAAYYTPPVDARTGQQLTYRLEPFLPMITYTDKRIPGPPLIPLSLPGGQLRVQVLQPDGVVLDLGSAPFAQSFIRFKTTRGGYDINPATVELDNIYSLMTAGDKFRITFKQYGYHVITLTGIVSDIWGNTYTGGGTYDLWVAQPLDMDPGVLPGTPFQTGDAFNPRLQVYPQVPADVRLTLTLYPNSDQAHPIVQTVTGKANRYGHFASTSAPPQLTQPGEYRVDLTATYAAADGTLYMGTMTWGSVVETPGTPLVAHGRRGVDKLNYIPNHWFVSCRDLKIRPGAGGHHFNPYYHGDIIWSRKTDAPGECPQNVGSCGNSLIMGASITDTVGAIEGAIRARAQWGRPLLYPIEGNLEDRFQAGEIPLWITTRASSGSSGSPPMAPNEIDQMAYSYRSSQRPGERVRELVGEDNMGTSYWRLDTLYDDQLGVGTLGDLPNDYKFQYIGIVYRDLPAGINQYAIHGTFWIFIPDSDTKGTRVMPPFSGPGNAGWTTEGGPLLKLKGEDIHIFILPTGTKPGAVLEIGDTFRFAGHIAPTLDSRVEVKVTPPSGAAHVITGQANKVGYFYNPAGDFSVDQAGLWSVDVRVWHDGVCSGGQTLPPYPSGNVLGSENGRYWFYVAPRDAPRLDVTSPQPGFLAISDFTVPPVTITGPVPAGFTDVIVDYTIAMPGYILQHGQANISGGTYTIVFDPEALHKDFPNLDLVGRDGYQRAGLSDTFAIGLLLRGKSQGNVIYRAGTITIQGEQVYIENALVGPQ